MYALNTKNARFLFLKYTIFKRGIDNCVGVNSDVIFKLACECQYGVKKHGDKYFIDTKIF